MMIVLKYLPLALEVIKVLREVSELGVKLYETMQKKAKTIQDGQQTSIEDRELLKINQELGVKNSAIAEVIYTHAIPAEDKDKADKPEIKEALGYVQMVANGIVGLVCTVACLKTAKKQR